MVIRLAIFSRLVLSIVTAGILVAGPVFAEPISQIIGTTRIHTVRQDQTLLEIARRSGLGFVELVAANPGVDPWLPDTGAKLLLPTAHILPEAPYRGIVINLAEQRLYYFPPSPGPTVSHPIASGKASCETPVGTTHIARKRRNPTWIPPASIRAVRPETPAAVPPGPANPLGDFALNLGWPGYVIHGTNKPLGIGRRVTHGCIRMYPEDIARLFDRVGVGSPVAIVDQPVKIGRSNGQIFLEVHPTQTQIDEIEEKGTFMHSPAPALRARIAGFAGADAVRIDWTIVERAAIARRGIPVRITQ